MIYLFCSILISSTLYVIFKCFQRFGVKTFEAIVVNYITACATGFILYPPALALNQIPETLWFQGTFLLGFLFIAVFMIMALTAQRSGLSTASVASKMSVVLPILFGYFVYQETLGVIRVAGMFLALVAVYLSAVKDEATVFSWKSLSFPILLFLGSGAIDILLKYTEKHYVPDEEISVFSSSIFGMAGILGILYSAFLSIRKRVHFGIKEFMGGIALGIPNYFSIYFLLKALKTEVLPSSTLFTINNVGIVLLSSMLGVWIFRERMLTRNWIGVGLAALSIWLITTGF